MLKYVVVCGCLVKDFENLESAFAHAWGWARELAEIEEVPADKLGQFGDGEFDEWRVCPEDSDGAFWPGIVRRVKR